MRSVYLVRDKNSVPQVWAEPFVHVYRWAEPFVHTVSWNFALFIDLTPQAYINCEV